MDKYKLFKQLPKPANLHIHFSGFISYKCILQNIVGNDELFDNILINEKNSHIGFYKEISGDSYRKLKLSDIEALLDIVNLHDININMMCKKGDIFYGIIKNFDYLKKYYLPDIIKKMDDHNISYVQFRLKLGSVVDTQGNYVDILDELETLYKYKDRFSIIVQSSKCNKKSIQYFEKIIKLVKNTKFSDFIIGYDLVGDEHKCDGIESYYDDLLRLQNTYGINYYFHAGEVPLNKKSVKNVEYAIQLKSVRIGHGINTFTNDKINNQINLNNIYREICPVSNLYFYNYALNICDIRSNINHIVVGSDDDNKLLSNLTLDLMYLYELGMTLDEIYILLLNSSHFVPNFDKAKFDKQYDDVKKKIENMKY